MSKAKERDWISLPPEIWEKIDKKVHDDMKRGGRSFVVLQLVKIAFEQLEKEPKQMVKFGNISYDPSKVNLNR